MDRAHENGPQKSKEKPKSVGYKTCQYRLLAHSEVFLLFSSDKEVSYDLVHLRPSTLTYSKQLRDHVAVC